MLKGVDSRRPRGHHGQSLVEFALFAPLFAFLVLGAADLARVFYYNVAITNMAREAARHGAYFDPTTGTNQFANNASILAVVRAEDLYIGGPIVAEPYVPGTAGTCPGSASHHQPPYASSLWPTTVNSANVYICFNDTDANTTALPSQPLRVTVLYTFQPMAPLIWGFLGANGNFHVTGTAEFTVEGL